MFRIIADDEIMKQGENEKLMRTNPKLTVIEIYRTSCHACRYPVNNRYCRMRFTQWLASKVTRQWVERELSVSRKENEILLEMLSEGRNVVNCLYYC